MRGLLSGVDWIRTLNPDALPESGMVVATVGRFTLILRRGWYFELKLRCPEQLLTPKELDDLRELMEVHHEWATYHKQK